MLSTASKTAIKVLLFDDDEDDAIITQALLDQSSEQRFEIEWARSFDRGLTRMKEHDHDSGLLDFNLGTKTGIDFLREVLLDQQHPSIIMLTGKGNESLVLQAFESGAIDYLPKRHISSENLQRAICQGVKKVRRQGAQTAYQRQLENTNNELKHRTVQIHRFSHLLAHELETPLTAASECMSILLKGIPGPLNPEQTDYLHLIQACCEHVDRHIHDLYDLTRLEAGQLRLDLQSEALPSLISEVLTYLRPKVQASGLTLQAWLAPNLPHVIMDTQRIRQVLLHLLENTLKFTEATGRILIEACEDPLCPGRVRIAIQDSGMGIPPDQLTGIFEHLYQLEKEPTDISHGLGLGLCICRELIKLHEGTMSVTSTPGQGSTFSFTLPCAPAYLRSHP